MDLNGLEQLIIFGKKWFPHEMPEEETLARSLWLERNYWEKMQAAVANGIAKAFNG